MKTLVIIILCIFALGSCTDTQELMKENKKQDKEIVVLQKKIVKLETVLKIAASTEENLKK